MLTMAILALLAAALGTGSLSRGRRQSDYGLVCDTTKNPYMSKLNGHVSDTKMSADLSETRMDLSATRPDLSETKSCRIVLVEFDLNTAI
jgi:hypothetical protein